MALYFIFFFNNKHPNLAYSNSYQQFQVSNSGIYIDEYVKNLDSAGEFIVIYSIHQCIVYKLLFHAYMFLLLYILILTISQIGQERM